LAFGGGAVRALRVSDFMLPIVLGCSQPSIGSRDTAVLSIRGIPIKKQRFI
jgi:hypothetical protein